jgi:hypothetical protein
MIVQGRDEEEYIERIVQATYTGRFEKIIKVNRIDE